MDAIEQRVAALAEKIIRIDERQQRDREDLLETRNQVAGISGKLEKVDRQLTQLTASIDGRIGKAMWGYAMGAVGFAAALVALLARLGGV